VLDNLLRLDWWNFSYEAIEVNIFSLPSPKPDALPDCATPRLLDFIDYKAPISN